MASRNIAQKPHFPGFMSLPTVSIPEDLRKNIEKLISEHPSVNIPAVLARIQSLKNFWSDEEVACLRKNRSEASKALKPKPVAQHVLAAEQGPIQYRIEEAVSYVAENMPGSYAAHCRVFSEIKRRVPDFRPQQMLDFGSGPGTSMWAAREVWPGCLQRATMVETSPAMLSVCNKLSEGVVTLPLVTTLPLLPNAGKVPDPKHKKHDLVICAFTMNELPAFPHRMAVAKYLWTLTSDMLVIIEPATLAGSSLIQRLRSRVITSENSRVREQYRGLYMPVNATTTGLGVHVVAPCAHEGNCPFSKAVEGGICALKQMVQVKSANKREAKVKEEAFSFVVLRRGFRPRKLDWNGQVKPPVVHDGERIADFSGDWLRIMRTPEKLGDGITVPICMPVGKNAQEAWLEEVKILKSKDPELYELASQAQWGDLWER